MQLNSKFPLPPAIAVGDSVKVAVGLGNRVGVRVAVAVGVRVIVNGSLGWRDGDCITA